MRDPIVAFPADQPDALSGVDSKTDIENMEVFLYPQINTTVPYLLLIFYSFEG